MNASDPRVLFLSAVLSLAPAARPALAAPETVEVRASRDVKRQLEQVDKQLQNADENIRFVETQFTQRPEPSDEEAKLRRFSDGEIQYLLGDWTAASVLFYDLVSDPRFRAHALYPDALFYLSDSLLEQQNYIGARLYLRELLSLPPTDRYKDALSRYLNVASRLNQFDGIDDYIAQARKLSGGQLPPELAYVYAKWLFRRADLKNEERIARAREAFEPLMRSNIRLVRLQSAYHLGVLSVQAGDLKDAIERFRELASLPVNVPEEVRIRELTNLSLGRLLYETGNLDEALDRYQQIPGESESFVDSLYEVSWTYVKKGDFSRAKNAIDILLLVDPESSLAPDAKLLQGHLLLKLQQYEEATTTYQGVIDTYGPVRNKLDELLSRTIDPVAYFDNLLSRNERTLDLSVLLPPVALRYAQTQEQVAGAVALVNDLESGRKGVGEARALATRILQALEERGLETFPELQEGYTRADAVESGLTRVEQVLVAVESSAVLEHLTSEERKKLEAVREEREALARRFALLPTTQREVEERRQRMQARVDELDREAFRLGYELQSLRAVATAVRKWVEDTRAERNTPPEEEVAFLGQLQAEADTLEGLQSELEHTRLKLADERNAVATSVGGEELIRQQFYEVLQREHLLVASFAGRLPDDVAALMTRLQQVRERTDALRTRVTTAKGQLRAQLERRGRVIRDKVQAEQALLGQYDTEVAAVSGQARNLVGRIAFDSFRRVRQQFYDLVLKGDVGMVDVAFTRKQDKTVEIQKLSAQKDKELRELERDFKEVLKDVE
ncbi:tetratricopeptide repeat protein [Hyalangium rubrum]|uniref:Tetratricopeptide repeat protein n=1 Tax=Hyalangium rubrum TaxID=3103134 RepID=A0ABU5H6A5_9BACT|nr:tetratricopeptide repeat protein [Hyalangium sp. s54d21]MDY7229009.1 tetratricopeptide repeat protein [Hyalangium sp. s54d21]